MAKATTTTDDAIQMNNESKANKDRIDEEEEEEGKNCAHTHTERDKSPASMAAASNREI